jgi:hypothetical protein
MRQALKQKIVEIAVTVTMIPLLPLVLVAGTGMWLIDKFVLTDEDRYQLGKKW